MNQFEMNKPRKDGTEHVTEVKKCEDYMTREAVIGNKTFKQTNPYNWKPVSDKDFKKMKAVKKAKKNGTWVEEEKKGEVYYLVSSSNDVAIKHRSAFEERHIFTNVDASSSINDDDKHGGLSVDVIDAYLLLNSKETIFFGQEKENNGSDNEEIGDYELLEVVDFVVIFEEDTPINLIKQIKPDVLVKGGDYEGKTIVGQDIAKEVKLVKFIDGKSTTNTIEKISNI